MNIVPDFVTDYSSESEFHSVVTIQLGELIKAGVVDFSDDSWKWDAYSDEQYERLCKKIENRFYYREISIIPVGHWKREYLRKMNEIMPKYKLLYAKLDAGINILQDSNKYGKSRQIFSDFPETMLGDNSDYASNGNDREYEDIQDGATLDKIADFVERYNDVDVSILNEIETLFSCLLTVSMNGF